MQDLKKPAPKKPKKEYVNQNPVESLEGLLGDFKKSFTEDVIKGTARTTRDSLKEDLAKGGANELWKELLNVDSPKPESNHGDLSEGSELNLEELYENTVEVTEMGREYSSEVIQAGTRANKEASQEDRCKIAGNTHRNKENKRKLRRIKRASRCNQS